MNRWLLAAIVATYFASTACALDSNKAMSQYIHDRWGADRGFLGGTVYAICQSEDGYLWIGTQRGLVRFDGSDFTLIQRPIPGSSRVGAVRGLVLDGEGTMWVRLDGEHLLLYRQGKFEDVFDRLRVEDAGFAAMSRDNSGGVLLVGTSNHIFRYSQGKLKTIANAEDLELPVVSIAETPGGILWAGARDRGLYRLNRGSAPSITRAPANTNIDAILPDQNGGLWLGTETGIKFWDGKELTKTNLPSSINKFRILALAGDHDGNVWAGSDHGLIRITPERDVSFQEADHHSGNEVTAVYEDHERDLWFGDSQDIERLHDATFTTYSTAEGLPSESNGAIYADSEGRTWFAPLSGGLFWLEGGQVKRVTTAGLGNDVVYSISGGGGEIWVGRQRGGLTRLTRSGQSLVARTYTKAEGLAEDAVYSVYRNHDGTVWAGTVSGGVTRLKGGVLTNYSTANGLASNSVNSIIEGHDGTTWLATPNGLSSFVNGHWRNRTVQDGLPSSDVITVFEDAKGVLWVGTSAGLAFLNSGQIKTPNSIPDVLREQILGIAEDRRGYLWITTPDRVLRVDRDRLLAGPLGEPDIRSFGIRDGLRGTAGVRRDRTVVTDALGRIWISLNQGLAVADPNASAKYSPPVMARIESISAAGKQVNLAHSLTLAAGTQNIVFNYAGTKLSNPERIRFRYKLDGSGQGWSDDVALRQVVYNHLGPGSYRFRVMASSGDGLWNSPETIVPFEIEPEFWQTMWFRALCVAAFLLAMLTLYQFRMHRTTQRLRERFQERLAERVRIAQELHDTLLQGFLSASMQLDVAEEQLPEDSPAKPALRRILQLMARVTEEGRNALRDLRAEEAEAHNLELAFSSVGQEFSIDERIRYRVLTQSTARPLQPVIRDEVYRIGREALVNAFLHAQATSVDLEIEYGSKYLRVLVRDDGRGIDPEVLQTGREGHWGLSGMRERSEGIGAILKLRSRTGAGTEVELTVPGAIAFQDQPRTSRLQRLTWLNRERFEPGANGRRPKSK